MSEFELKLQVVQTDHKSYVENPNTGQGVLYRKDLQDLINACKDERKRVLDLEKEYVLQKKANCPTEVKDGLVGGETPQEEKELPEGIELTPELKTLFKLDLSDPKNLVSQKPKKSRVKKLDTLKTDVKVDPVALQLLSEMPKEALSHVKNDEFLEFVKSDEGKSQLKEYKKSKAEKPKKSVGDSLSKLSKKQKKAKIV